MNAIALNKPVPDFELPATGDKQVRLSDPKGNTVVIYFYPKDNTPGCTLEGQDFRDQYAKPVSYTHLRSRSDGCASRP